MRNKKKYPTSIIKSIERYRKWKKRKDIWFDVDKANEMLDFVQSFVRHVKGPLAGELISLEEWEMFIFANMYGWYHENEKGNIVRVIREAYVQVPKKNGKTIIAAGALLYAMYGEGERGADCYCAATDYEQAQNAAEPIAQAIENSKPLSKNTQIYKGINGTVSGAMYRYSIDGITYQNKFKVLTKNTKGLEGKNPYFVLNDELHAQENMDMYDNLKSAQVSREQPMTLNISTAGKGSSSVGMRVYKYAKSVLKEDEDDSLFVYIAEPNRGYDWTDRKVWEMVNPNIGISVTMETLEIEFKKAQQSAHSKAEFLSKHLNVFVNGAENYFEREQIEHVLVEDLGNLDGEMCYIGLDLSKVNDLTCVDLNFPTFDDEGKALLKVKQMYFIPSENLDFREKEDNVPYSDLVERGFVTLCDGKMIDQDMVLEYITECMNLYDVQQINYDPAMSQKLIEKCENLGLDCIVVNQYPNVMNAMIDDAELLIYEHKLITDNPLFLYCALNMVVITNINGMKGPSKRQSKKKIDGFVAFLVAHKETMFQMEDINADEFDELLDSIYR
ncbi:terminase large subunit [Rummeliibacillus sp. POC4]|nr:terminase TerL endonuclease subunit [Rummeliibacillus sp. POC4]RIJ65553.1 terminase large subunit [Rummeliibacillus sp. POC4]